MYQLPPVRGCLVETKNQTQLDAPSRAPWERGLGQQLVTTALARQAPSFLSPLSGPGYSVPRDSRKQVADSGKTFAENQTTLKQTPPPRLQLEWEDQGLWDTDSVKVPGSLGL